MLLCALLGQRLEWLSFVVDLIVNKAVTFNAKQYKCAKVTNEKKKKEEEEEEEEVK